MKYLEPPVCLSFILKKFYIGDLDGDLVVKVCIHIYKPQGQLESRSRLRSL